MNRRDFAGLAALGALSGAASKAAVPQSPQRSSSEPRLFRQFERLPVGSVLPGGWLEEYCRINANGWILKYATEQVNDVWGRYIHRTSNPKLGFTANDEWIDAPDYGAYFGEALVHYAALHPGPEVEAAATQWVNQLVASQDADGYIGGFQPAARWQCWLEMFSQSLLIDALLARYEATGDQAALKTALRSGDLIAGIWWHPPKQADIGIFVDHGAVIVRSMGKLYAATGNAKYRDCGREVLARFGRTKQYLAGGNAVVHEHDAIGTEHVGLPVAVYEYVGDPDLLKASEAAFEMELPLVSVDGTPHGNEQMFEKGSLANSEHCGAVEWMITCRDLARITGKVKYADAVEKAMYNGYPAPKTPDGLAVAYMHSPNQLVASEWSQPHKNDGDLDWWASRQHYSTAHEPLCCNANGPRGIPFFVDGMLQRSANGLAVSYYGPCKATAELPEAGKVTITLDTRYPFEDEVRATIEVARPAAFPLQFRIPGWCQTASLQVNGTDSGEEVKPGTYVTLRRTWSSGDKVRVAFVNPIRILVRRKSEFKIRARAAVVQRGPLVFSLPVEADLQEFVPPAHSAGKEIKAYRAFPSKEAVWNYAFQLDPEHPESSATLKQLAVPAGSKPWDSHPPIGLEVRARRILNWRMEGEPEHPRTPGLPYRPMRLADEVETVVLVPYGSTRLRITYLPLVPGQNEA